MVIAIDFDGTIVENKFPDIGEPLLFAFETLREMQKKNYRLILWTCRHGKQLEDAVEFCASQGVQFYAINRNYPEQTDEDTAIAPKIFADLYIDDRSIGGFPGWSQVWQMISNEPLLSKKDQYRRIKKSNSIFRKWFNKSKKN